MGSVKNKKFWEKKLNKLGLVAPSVYDGDPYSTLFLPEFIREEFIINWFRYDGHYNGSIAFVKHISGNIAYRHLDRSQGVMKEAVKRTGLVEM